MPVVEGDFDAEILLVCQILAHHREYHQLLVGRHDCLVQINRAQELVVNVLRRSEVREADFVAVLEHLEEGLQVRVGVLQIELQVGEVAVIGEVVATSKSQKEGEPRGVF